MNPEEEIKQMIASARKRADKVAEEWKKNPSVSRYAIGYLKGLEEALKVIKKE